MPTSRKPARTAGITGDLAFRVPHETRRQLADRDRGAGVHKTARVLLLRTLSALPQSVPMLTRGEYELLAAIVPAMPPEQTDVEMMRAYLISQLRRTSGDSTTIATLIADLETMRAFELVGLFDAFDRLAHNPELSPAAVGLTIP